MIKPFKVNFTFNKKYICFLWLLLYERTIGWETYTIHIDLTYKFDLYGAYDNHCQLPIEAAESETKLDIEFFSLVFNHQSREYP